MSFKSKFSFLWDLPQEHAEIAIISRERSHKIWKAWQLIAFRVAFVFYALLIIPFKWDFYVKVFTPTTLFDWLGAISGTRPDFVKIPTESGRWGIASYSTWGIALLGGLLAALIWTLLARRQKTPKTEYNVLYYWLLVAVRYRIALGIIAFGLIKLFPMQMPFPSLANLETNFGDFSTYKIYWQSVGVVIWYEVFLGFVEVAAGFLMFYRSTATLGAVINAGVLYNIAHANHAYDGGVHVYSAYFVLLSVFVFAYDAPRLWDLLIKERDVVYHHFIPTFTTKWKKIALPVVKYTIIFVFVIVIGAVRFDLHYNQGRLKEPVTPGLTGAEGYYNVSEFRLNNQVLPYSPQDSVRWHDVIFEKYATLVYKVNKPLPIVLANGTPHIKDLEKSYELAGIAGGRRFLYYDADTVRHTLTLQDKNTGRREGEEQTERKKEKEKEKEQPKIVLTYERPSATRIILSGLNEKKDSIYVVLDRIPKNYLINKGRRDYAAYEN